MHHLLEDDVDEGAPFVLEALGMGEVFATACTALDSEHPPLPRGQEMAGVAMSSPGVSFGINEL